MTDSAPHAMHDNQQVVLTGLKLKGKQLEALAKEAETAGYPLDAARYRSDRTEIEETLMERVRSVGYAALSGLDRNRAYLGVGIYIHNTRAAAGTLRGLDHDALAQAFKEHATAVEAGVYSDLAGTPQLALETGGAAAETTLAGRRARP